MSKTEENLETELKASIEKYSNDINKLIKTCGGHSLKTRMRRIFYKWKEIATFQKDNNDILEFAKNPIINMDTKNNKSKKGRILEFLDYIVAKDDKNNIIKKGLGRDTEIPTHLKNDPRTRLEIIKYRDTFRRIKKKHWKRNQIRRMQDKLKGRIQEKNMKIKRMKYKKQLIGMTSGLHINLRK